MFRSQVCIATLALLSVCVLATAQPTNLAEVCRVSAGSVHQDNEPRRAVDGVVSDASRWVSKRSGPHWLQLDLGSVRTIRSAHVYSGWQNRSAVRNFSFEYRHEGRWIPIPRGRVTANRKAFVAVTFAEEVRARHLRFVSGDEGHARIREIMLWRGAPPPRGTGTSERSDPSLVRRAFARDRHAIALNQVGYVTDGPKRFTAPLSADGSRFVIRAGDSEEPLFSGEIRSGIGDFTAFKPEHPVSEYRIHVRGGDLAAGRSHPFTIGENLWVDAFWQSAVDFMIDCRSVVGTHPSAFGGCPWRDATYYSFEVPSLVMMLLSDPDRVRRMPRQIDWARDRDRVLAKDFRFDAKNPCSKGVMKTVRGYYRDLPPPAGDAPDVVKLIHWGLGYYLLNPETRDPSNDPLPKQLHSQTLEQFAFLLYAWPSLKQWLPQSFHDRCRDFAFAKWREVGLLGIDPLWKPESWLPPIKKGDDWALGAKLHPYKGRHCPGHAILPNLLLHAVADRLGRDDAGVYLEAAVRQAKWVVDELDWQDPRATKGQRMSEHKLMTGLVWLMQHHPRRAPKGLEAKIASWARAVVAHSENQWDFRRYDLKAHWSLPKMNEPGNLAGFPAIAIAACWVLDDERLETRLRQIAYAHVDNLFGRNPQLAAAPHRPDMGFPLVEVGWPKGHPENVCARLELVRGALSASPGTEKYPFNPEGEFRHPEGWCAFNSAWNVSLAYLARERAGSLR